MPVDSNSASPVITTDTSRCRQAGVKHAHKRLVDPPVASEHESSRTGRQPLLVSPASLSLCACSLPPRLAAARLAAGRNAPGALLAVVGESSPACLAEEPRHCWMQEGQKQQSVCLSGVSALPEQRASTPSQSSSSRPAQGQSAEQ
jgi:hypothetical protein